MPLPSVAAFDRVPDAMLAEWRASFARAGYGADTLDRASAIAAEAPAATRLPMVQWQLGRESAPDLRIALLLTYAGSLERAEAERLFGAGPAGALLDAGILEAREDRVSCPFRMATLDEVFILSDNQLDQPESVMPPGPTTMTFAHVIQDLGSGSLLDVGTGPGSLALFAAARGASPVVGTDINGRALPMARLNARLNGLAAEFLEGDVFEPVRGRRFRTVVAQPPYVLRPREIEEIQFLHAGPRGDAVLVRLLEGAAAVLEPKGEALFRADLALREGETLEAYLAERAGGRGLDLLVLHSSGFSPHLQAILYARHATTDMGPEYLKEVERHVEHMERERIASFRQAFLVAKRAAPDARTLSIHAMPAHDLSAASPAIRERLWASFSVTRVSDAELMRRRVRVAPDAEWVSLRDAPEGEQREHRVRFGSGWPALEQIVTDEGVALASLLERSATVADAVAGYAELCEGTVAEMKAPVLAYIRTSLLNGLLVFEDAGVPR